MKWIDGWKDLRPALFRMALGITAVSLWAYIPYRYATRPPRVEGVLGTAYAVLFPLAAVLALAALVAAWRPNLVDRLLGRHALRGALGVYGGAWLAMGLLCVPSLQAMTAVAPLKGAMATIHMTAQHVFLGLAAVAAAWRPEATASILVGRPVVPEAVGTPSSREIASG